MIDTRIVNLTYIVRKISVALVVTLVCMSPAFSSDYFIQLAEKYYKQGEYQNAANVLALASSENPNNAYLHYMRGNAFALLKRHAEAQEEYKIAVALDRTGVVGKYSKQGLATLDDMHKAARPKLLPPPDRENSSAQEVSTQLAEVKNRLMARCDAKIDEINKAASEKMKTLDRERQKLISGFSGNDKVINEDYDRRINALRAETRGRIADTSAYYAHTLSLLRTP